ncbi:MAG: Lysine--tRNA ligase, partial [Devosia sp.]|nr:Lysine--tRNA ligase [Devosia sp.]
KPRVAKRLHFDVIPRTVDDYYAHVAAYQAQDAAARLENPAFHVHYGAVPTPDVPLSFALLLNLVATANAQDTKVMWGFISRYIPGASAATHPELDKLAGYAVRYFNDKIKPFKTYRAPTEVERTALQDLHDSLEAHLGSTNAEDLQNLVYEIGKKYQFEPLRDWFKAIYQVLLGDDQGPRFGSFIALYGVAETRKLIETALSGALLKPSEA